MLKHFERAGKRCRSRFCGLIVSDRDNYHWSFSKIHHGGMPEILQAWRFLLQ